MDAIDGGFDPLEIGPCDAPLLTGGAEDNLLVVDCDFCSSSREEKKEESGFQKEVKVDDEEAGGEAGLTSSGRRVRGELTSPNCESISASPSEDQARWTGKTGCLVSRFED